MTRNSCFDSYRSMLLPLLLVTLAWPGVASALWYKITDLGPVSPGMSGAMAVSPAGQVAGFSSVADPSSFRATLWDGSVQEIGSLAGDSQSNALAFGSSGNVYGVSYDFGDIGVHAFASQAGTLSGLGNFFVRGANPSDSLAGYQTLTVAGSGAFDHASLWQSGSLTDVGTLGGSNSYGRAINAAGDLAGVSYLADEVTTHAFLRRAGVLHDLGTLGGTNSEASAINDVGQIAGFAEIATGDPHACIFAVDAAGNVLNRTDLGQLGSGFSYANGINNLGRAVGISNGRAFLYRGTMLDLNHRIPTNSGWFLTNATSINDSGRIVGNGVHNGQFHAFALDPAPSGDFDGDGDVDMSDFGHLQICLSGPVPVSAGCEDADLDASGSVGSGDVSLFASCADGAGVPADSNCGN